MKSGRLFELVWWNDWAFERGSFSTYSRDVTAGLVGCQEESRMLPEEQDRFLGVMNSFHSFSLMGASWRSSLQEAG